jgi:NAD+ synthetase
MKVQLIQTNPTPGQFEDNVNQILEGLKEGEGKYADVVLTPELSICGYGVRDMVYDEGFIEKNHDYLLEVAEATNGMAPYVIVGYVDHNHSGSGKKFRNMAAVIRYGKVVATYQKQLLPFYDVFDEGRYFEAGTEPCIIEIAGKRCGLTICEDLWNDKGQDDYNYINNPVQTYRDLNVEVLLNISSSPYHMGKQHLRHSMLTKLSRDFDVVYCNQYGACDELVFDGWSSVYANGSLVEAITLPQTATAGLVQTTYVQLDMARYNPRTFFQQASLDNDNYHLLMTLLGLHNYVNKTNHNAVVVGSSGGIDSALVIALASIALGPDKVNAIMMPSIYSSDHSVNDAKELHANCGCKEYTVTIDHETPLSHINACLGLDNQPYLSVADENIQARLRGQVIMHYSNATNAIPLTTGNKTELALGYCTMYGDMCGGFNPIGDLYKLEVYDMARLINKMYGPMIPENIIEKAPSAELAPGQTDEASLMPYAELDPIVKGHIEEYEDTHDCPMTRRMKIMEFKRRQAAPCTRLTKKAFGTGRRYPIVKGI